MFYGTCGAALGNLELPASRFVVGDMVQFPSEYITHVRHLENCLLGGIRHHVGRQRWGSHDPGR